ncbi:hypothetical protein PSPO01_03994 [Paraphaeosphaeria sporulosa]
MNLNFPLTANTPALTCHVASNYNSFVQMSAHFALRSSGAYAKNFALRTDEFRGADGSPSCRQYERTFELTSDFQYLSTYEPIHSHRVRTQRTTCSYASENWALQHHIRHCYRAEEYAADDSIVRFAHREQRSIKSPAELFEAISIAPPLARAGFDYRNYQPIVQRLCPPDN